MVLNTWAYPYSRTLAHARISTYLNPSTKPGFLRYEKSGEGYVESGSVEGVISQSHNFLKVECMVLFE